MAAEIRSKIGPTKYRFFHKSDFFKKRLKLHLHGQNVIAKTQKREMRKCKNMKMRKRKNAETRKCENAKSQKRKNAQMWKHENAAMALFSMVPCAARQTI